jgi:chromosome segregation ATPase
MATARTSRTELTLSDRRAGGLADLGHRLESDLREQTSTVEQRTNERDELDQALREREVQVRELTREVIELDLAVQERDARILALSGQTESLTRHLEQGSVASEHLRKQVRNVGRQLAKKLEDVLALMGDKDSL